MSSQDNTLTITPANPYYAATERAVAAQQPFQGRKRSLKRASGFQAGAGLQQAFLIEGWMCAGQSQAIGADTDRPAAPRSD
jgi:hypothetical protein